MAVAYSDLRRKLENAVAATVTALGVSGLSIYTGHDDETQTLPKCVCVADDISEAIPETGNCFASVRVMVASTPADTTPDDHAAIVATVFDALAMDDLPATLIANGSALHVHGIRSMAMDSQIEDRHFIDSMTVQLMAAPSTI